MGAFLTIGTAGRIRKTADFSLVLMILLRQSAQDFEILLEYNLVTGAA
jgi:hypothetical protein